MPLIAFIRTEVNPVLPRPTEVQLASIEDLKGALLNPPMHALPNPSLMFVVDVDACADQLGAAWLRESAAGELHPARFYSRSLLPAEQSYCMKELECLGLVCAVLPLRDVLHGTHFTIMDDPDGSPGVAVGRQHHRSKQPVHSVAHTRRGVQLLRFATPGPPISWPTSRPGSKRRPQRTTTSTMMCLILPWPRQPGAFKGGGMSVTRRTPRSTTMSSPRRSGRTRSSEFFGRISRTARRRPSERATASSSDAPTTPNSSWYPTSWANA